LFPFHVIQWGVCIFLYWGGAFQCPPILLSFYCQGFSACLLERSHEARSFVQIKQARRFMVGHGAQKGKEKQMFEEYGKRRTMAGMGRLIPITRSSEGLDDEDISTQGTDFEHGWTDGRASGVLCIIKKGTLEGPIA
jgi:hypothetical protein